MNLAIARSQRSTTMTERGRLASRAPLHRHPRSAADRRELVRFVVVPDGEVVPDVDERLPGRGLWLTPRAI